MAGPDPHAPQPFTPPKPPYYAVIFTSLRADADPRYDTMAVKMVELARAQPGCLGMDSARGTDGLGITVSYWRSEDDIQRWKENARHVAAQKLGIDLWYAAYSLHVAKVERSYGGPR